MTSRKVYMDNYGYVENERSSIHMENTERFRGITGWRRKKAAVCAAWVWALLSSLAGCASTSNNGTFKDRVNQEVSTVVQTFYPAYQTIALKDLAPDYDPPKQKAANTWDLAKLARPTENEHRFVAGDLVQVSCFNLMEEGRMATFPAHVDDDGAIALPLMKERVDIHAMTAAEAERAISEAYVASRNIRQPQLTLRILEPKTNTIYVIGAVKKPGAYELQPDDCDPLRAIVAAGGITEEAGSIVEVRRGGKQTPQPKFGLAALPPISTRPKQKEKLPPTLGFDDGSNPVGPLAVRNPNLVDTSAQSDSVPRLPPPFETVALKSGTGEPPSANVPQDEGVLHFDLRQPIAKNLKQLELQNGDIVSVEPKKLRPIYVAGSVNKPGEFPMPVDRDIRLLEAVGLAGGVNVTSEPTCALIIRRPSNQKAVVVHVNLREAARNPQANPRLMEGDVISVVEDAASRTRKVIRTYLGFGADVGVPIP